MPTGLTKFGEKDRMEFSIAACARVREEVKPGPSLERKAPVEQAHIPRAHAPAG